MAIISLFAITLLSSAHALDLPSSSEVMGHFQRPHSSLKAEVLASTQNIFAPLKSIPQDIQRSRASYFASPLQPHIMQDIDQAACTAAANAPCIAGFADLALVSLADSASAAVAIFEQFCTACTEPAAQYEAFVTDCGLTGEDALGANLQGALVEAVCLAPTCAASAAWGSAALPERRDALCPNYECASDVLMAGGNFSEMGMLNVTEFRCQEQAIELMCLTDADDSSIYCADFMMQDQLNASAICATTCPRYLTLLQLEYQQQCMGVGMDSDTMTGDSDTMTDDSDTMTGEDEECDFPPFTLNDVCVQNANEVYCQDFFVDLMEMGPNVTECGIDDVPAPGVEQEAPTECSAECQGQLQAFVDSGLCCTGLFLEMSCPDPSLLTFIETTCGVAYDVCERPPLPTRTPITEAPTEEVDRAAAIGVSTAVISILAIAALAALS